ncbi:MAG: AAA family ATPase [Treponema sp.]|jgi:DNA transposition AAA+ family ATPase|nr:AAA family ATPase [Treponema sp.]
MNNAPAVISAYKSRAYNGDVKGLEERMDAWLARDARRLSRIEVPTAETAAMEQIRAAIAIAHEEASIAVIVGDAGSGKTTALRRYAIESHSALLVDVDPSFSQIVLMSEIAGCLGVEGKGGANAVIDRVIGALKDRD